MSLNVREIRKHYEHACEKHPGFCYGMLPLDWKREDIRREIDENLGDESAMESWLVNGVPDGLSWDVLNADADRDTDYMGIAQDMEDSEFEDIVHLFASIVRRECFKTVYEPKTFC